MIALKNYTPFTSVFGLVAFAFGGTQLSYITLTVVMHIYARNM